MRFLAAVAIVVPILAAAYVLSRGPWPEPKAQTAAAHVADSLTRARVDSLNGGQRTGRVSVGATRRGRLAWAAAEHVADAGTQQASWHTVAYVFRDHAWRVLIEHDAPAPTWDELRTGTEARRHATPPAFDAPEGRDAERLAKRFRRALEHFGRMRVDRRAIAVGPAAEQIAVGDSAVKAMVADWERRLGEPRIVEGGLLVRAPRRLGVGWVVANLEVSPPGWGGETLPLRLAAVYRERDEDSWGLVLAHLSVVVPVLSEPARAASLGAGR